MASSEPDSVWVAVHKTSCLEDHDASCMEYMCVAVFVSLTYMSVMCNPASLTIRLHGRPVLHLSMLVLSLLFEIPHAQQVLLEHGVVTNQADTEGVTPLLACIEAVPNGTARLAVAEVSES